MSPVRVPSTEEVLWRDDIVTDGNLLDYDLQVTMQACCEEYGVPLRSGAGCGRCGEPLLTRMPPATPMIMASCKSIRSIMGGSWSKALTP